LARPPKTELLSFAGAAGAIEGVLETPDDSDLIAVVVVCHPHPMHGGTMHNKVAHTLARAFVGIGFATLRFNFRGVGASDGSFDDGKGEVQDVQSAVACIRERFPGLPLWLAGFSFGAAMSIRAAVDTDLNGLVSVAPAAYRFAGELGVQPDCPWLIVHGDDDELVPVGETVEWVDSLDPGPELQVFPATSHFFHGKLVELREAVRTFVEENEAALKAQ
jgi:alpha/beta superfamily hydrolase